MSSSQLLLIVDDPQLNATYAGGQWGTSNFLQWYGGSIIYPQFADTTTATVTGSLFLSFEGVLSCTTLVIFPELTSQNRDSDRFWGEYAQGLCGLANVDRLHRWRAFVQYLVQ